MTQSAGPCVYTTLLSVIAAIILSAISAAECSADPEMVRVPVNDAVQLLKELESKWQDHLYATPFIKGSAELRQSTLLSSFTSPKRNSEEQVDKQDRVVEVSEQCIRSEVVSVSFKGDLSGNRHWCHWEDIEPASVKVASDGTVKWNSDRNAEYVSIETPDEFLHHPVGSKVSALVDSLSAIDLVKIDLQHGRKQRGFRGIAFRTAADTGRGFKERSCMFEFTQLLRIGGQLPNDYLSSVARSLQSEGNVQVSVGKDDSSQLHTLKIVLRSTLTNSTEPNLTVETVWKKVDGVSFLLPESVVMDIAPPGGGSSTQRGDLFQNNYYETRWVWNVSRVHGGSLFLSEWDFSVRANATAKSNFHRHVVMKEWDVVSKFEDEEFGPRGLEVETGDLIYDDSAKSVKYVAADKELVDVSIARKKDAPPATYFTMSSGALLVYLNVVIVCAVVLFRYRRAGKRR
ncbi:MAG: hypothetical protein U0941_03585 [Planctomycetaceae bacterium]